MRCSLMSSLTSSLAIKVLSTSSKKTSVGKFHLLLVSSLSLMLLSMLIGFKLDCAAFAAAFKRDIGLFEGDGGVNSLAHIVDGQGGYRCGGEGFHVNACLVVCARASLDEDETLLAIQRELKVNMRHGQLVTKGNELRCLLGGHDAGNLCHFQHASLRNRVGFDQARGLRQHTHPRLCYSLAHRFRPC